VIMNLVVNARDAMPQGGKLTLETANVTLDEAYTRPFAELRPGPYVMLAISDTGTGISPEVLARIFEPFFTTKPPGEGTGLGLSTVYGIVKQSDGHIRVYSEPGRGSTFKVYLPRMEPEVKPHLAEAVRSPGSAGPTAETVLLVEDEEGVRRLAGHVLRERGYVVLEACNPQEALEMTGHHPGPIHLMLTDVVMPGMSGCQLVERLAPRRPGMKVLYMSGYPDNTIVHHGVLDPSTAFLGKPFTPDKLVRKVQEVLRAAA
jgi:two-component system, cell cycle sensor histidine kinase and response regulator CckA